MYLGWEQWWQAAIAFAAAFGAGAINALAGGGTLLSFPTLIWLGLPPVSANATSAVALWPGGLGGAWGFREELARVRHWWLWLLVPSLAGGAVGAFLLIRLPSHLFEAIAPFLVLAAAAVMALEQPLTRLLHAEATTKISPVRRVAAVVAEFVIAVYGGYFGAGLGILVLTALGLLGLTDIRQANGLKNLLTLATKGAALVYFALAQAVVWHAAVLMAVGAIAGGYAAASLGHRMSARVMHVIVIAIGVGMAAAMLLRLGQ